MTKLSSQFWLCMAAAFGCWTVWCLLMVGVGEPFTLPLVRAVARVAVVAIPAIFYLRHCDSDDANSLGYGFTKYWKLGVIVGCIVAAIHIGVLFIIRDLNLSLMPTTLAIWGNYILFSPLAEELLFRRVAVEYFSDRYGTVIGILASTVMLSLIHLPWWILAGEYTAGRMFGLSLTLFGYGLGFGILYRATRSLWASLIPHTVNNLAATVFV